MFDDYLEKAEEFKESDEVGFELLVTELWKVGRYVTYFIHTLLVLRPFFISVGKQLSLSRPYLVHAAPFEAYPSRPSLRNSPSSRQSRCPSLSPPQPQLRLRLQLQQAPTADLQRQQLMLLQLVRQVPFHIRVSRLIICHTRRHMVIHQLVIQALPHRPLLVWSFQVRTGLILQSHLRRREFFCGDDDKTYYFSIQIPFNPPTKILSPLIPPNYIF